MSINRRNWLKQIGMGVAGVSMAPLENIAGTFSELSADQINDKPIRLVANENPYGPSPLARKAMAENMIFSNRYNGELLNTLISRVAQKNKVKSEKAVQMNVTVIRAFINAAACL